VVGIPELWKNFWVWPAFCRLLSPLAVSTTIELFQSKLKRVPLSNQPCRKVSRNSFAVNG
jgi:hypothetical protein